MVAQRAGTPPQSPIVLSGIVPPLADSYYQRPETGLALSGNLYPGDTVVLTHGEPSAVAPAAQGGTGKTQLAVAYIHALWSAREVEALIWITATDRDAVITGFAQAADAVGAGDHDADAEAAAARFVAWLAQTRRPWALVVDDLAEVADLDGLWPAGPAGQVVITTRLPSDALKSSASQNSDGGSGPGPWGGSGSWASGLRIVPVGGFNPREAFEYLTARLSDDPDQRLEAVDLGEDLDGLPLALAQAAAVMKASGLGCRQYRERLGERLEHMSGVLVDGVSAAVLATWSLAAECAHELAPAGLAWPALALAAVLDPHGIPGAVLTSPAACGYIAGRPSHAGEADQNLARAAITNLARVGLISIDPVSPVRTVRMHPSVQAAVRAYLPPADLEQAMLAAADALIQAWPESGGEPRLDQARLGQARLDQARLGQARLDQARLGQALRDCTSALWGSRQVPANPLWKPDAHPVLFRKGTSLEEGGLAESAIRYWQTMLITSTRLLGTGHANAVMARDRLAGAYESAGRFGDAIAVFQNAAADRERNQGHDHPDAIAARGHLAHAYSSAGRPAEAIMLYEQMAVDAGRQLGIGHPLTLTARSQLAEAYLTAGRQQESLVAYQMLVTDAERILGPDHPTTRTIRENLDAASRT